MVGVFLSDPDSEVQWDHILHHTPKLGIPFEIVQFLLKLLLKHNSWCVTRFPLIASRYEIVDSQTSLTLESESEIL